MDYLHTPEALAKAAATREERRGDPAYKTSLEDDTSICWNYEDKEVEIFTNRKLVFKKCLERNPFPKRVKADDQERVYSLIYGFKDLRSPETILKVLNTQGTNDHSETL